MQCDMCGKDGELFIAVIEGTRLKACASCAKFGEIKGPARPPAPKPEKQASSGNKPSQAIQTVHQTPEETIEIVREDYAKIIRQARERKGLKQDEFAKLLSERESIVHALESGKHAPNIPMARKLEKILNVKLIKTITETSATAHGSTSTERTIGDIINKQK